MLVWIASFPRSGNRLCRSTLRHAFGQKTGVVGSGRLRGGSLTRFLERLGVDPDGDAVPVLREHPDPIFLKTHALPGKTDRWLKKEARRHGRSGPNAWSPLPAIYVVRDGRACFVSFAHYLKNVKEVPEFQAMSDEDAIASVMRRQGKPYGGWSGHVRAWREREAPTAILRFEDLIEDSTGTLAGGAAELGIELPEPRREAFSASEMRARSRNPTIVRSGKADSWRTEFPASLLDEFWELHGEQMQALGYPRE